MLCWHLRWLTNPFTFVPSAGVIGDLGMKAVVLDDVATATAALATLHLRGCSLKTEAFEAIGVGLAGCYTLKELRCASSVVPV